jgi:hypothetical protein
MNTETKLADETSKEVTDLAMSHQNFHATAYQIVILVNVVVGGKTVISV